ncbi:hypothetical protein OHA70_32055 [Kribbella sp. NBC_00382]|uniref:hypothetical protein n=1 Tax=Kribbella sp. NBC_00382 TaxID=2975967 RepID=UPI002E1A81C6
MPNAEFSGFGLTQGSRTPAGAAIWVVVSGRASAAEAVRVVAKSISAATAVNAVSRPRR